MLTSPGVARLGDGESLDARSLNMRMLWASVFRTDSGALRRVALVGRGDVTACTTQSVMPKTNPLTRLLPRWRFGADLECQVSRKVVRTERYLLLSTDGGAVKPSRAACVGWRSLGTGMAALATCSTVADDDVADSVVGAAVGAGMAAGANVAAWAVAAGANMDAWAVGVAAGGACCINALSLACSTGSI